MICTYNYSPLCLSSSKSTRPLSIPPDHTPPYQIPPDHTQYSYPFVIFGLLEFEICPLVQSLGFVLFRVQNLGFVLQGSNFGILAFSGLESELFYSQQPSKTPSEISFKETPFNIPGLRCKSHTWLFSSLKIQS